MINFKNYYIYAEAIKSQSNVFINVPKKITAENIDDHINAITAILKDGIETDYVHNLLFTCSWGGDKEADLFIIDYWYNLFMWKMILMNGDPIKPYHIFWSPTLKRSDIKKYVDKFVLTIQNKIRLGNVFLNNNICEGLWPFSYVEAFSYYLGNTINNEDMIALMNKSPKAYNALHASFSNVPIGQVKDEGMVATNDLIDAIVNDSANLLGYDHGLKASFMASEAINPRQFKESVVNIGTKPNGSGGVWEHIVDKNFMNGGVNDVTSYFIESSASRYAQILSKKNVGDSGDIARVIGLNNTDTKLCPDPNFACNSPNLVRFQIKTKKHLSMMKDRYYRMSPMGMDHLVDDEDESLIGKTILLHSPMTCACNSRGGGICRRCYGDLYYTNININPGKMAAEILTSQLTQILLSAKHLLETKIRTMSWNAEFQEYFDIDINSISLASIDDDVNLKKYHMIIDLESIYLVNDEEDAISYEDDEEIIDDDSGVYNKYISKFWIKTPDGTEIEFGTKDQDPLYISNELSSIIKRKSNGADIGRVSIPLSSLEDNVLFYVKVMNDEISKTMDDIVNVINKSNVTKSMDIHQILQTLVDLVIKGNLSTDAIHLEVILSNQLVDPDNILKKPDWSVINARYKIFTLNQALTNNPSPIVSLLYKDLRKTLYTPLTYQKSAPSSFDLFFNEQPQNYMNDDVLDDNPNVMSPEKGITMVKIVEKNK